MPAKFSPPPTSKNTDSKRSRHASRHVRDARAVMHVGIANPAVAGKAFPAFPAHPQHTTLRIWQKVHVANHCQQNGAWVNVSWPCPIAVSVDHILWQNQLCFSLFPTIIFYVIIIQLISAVMRNYLKNLNWATLTKMPNSPKNYNITHFVSQLTCFSSKCFGRNTRLFTGLNSPQAMQHLLQVPCIKIARKYRSITWGNNISGIRSIGYTRAAN